jgi:mono/diheme cytochrome c family protein
MPVCGKPPRAYAHSFSARARRTAVAAGVGALVLGGLSAPDVLAQSRTVRDGVYTDAQATRGQALYKQQCSSCHGETLAGGQAPPLASEDFVRNWQLVPLTDLADKVKNTMPANAPGQLSAQQAADLVAHLLKVNRFPAGQAELSADAAQLKLIGWPAAAPRPTSAVPATAQTFTFQPLGNLAQIMRGVFFPSSNLIFNVQSHDPGAQRKGTPPPNPTAGSFSWVDWGAGIYAGWDLVDNAAVVLADAAPMMLIPGLRCENGRPVPMNEPEWIKFTKEMVDAARVAYKASQTRNQEAVSDATGTLADACMHCHEVYRDKRRGNVPRDLVDPANKAARCVK